ncbi:MAG: FliI/YscN family ATPase [Planctomycetota bacterium]
MVLAPEIETLGTLDPLEITGRVAEIRGMTLMVEQLPLPVGATVHTGEARVPGEVIGFRDGKSVVMLLGPSVGIRAGSACSGTSAAPTARVGVGLLGRVVNGLGEPLDGRTVPTGLTARALDASPIPAMRRTRVTSRMETGVRALDLMAPMGQGQRMGVFAGPGVGKSTLLGQIAKRTKADVSVIALIGERGREVRDFIEDSLGADGLARSVVVVATGDEPPPMRMRAAKLACCCAEALRDGGLNVMLMMDSITRFCHAQRQIGLSLGEPPATKGYTSSVWAQLALLLERAGGVDSGGTITGLYTILVEGDDMTEPVSDAARGILDGHVVLARRLAQKGHFPAIDVLDSVSRVADHVTTPEHRVARQRVLRSLAAYRDVEELVQIGAYARGSNPESDTAITLFPEIENLLRQSPADAASFDESLARLTDIALRVGKEG